MQELTFDSVPSLLTGLGPNPRIVVSGNFATPIPLMERIDDALDDWHYHCLNAMWAPTPRAGLTLETCFVGPAMRKRDDVSYIPCRLSLVPSLYRNTLIPDVVVLHTTTPRDSMVSMGVEVNVLPGAIEACRQNGGTVIAAVNPQMPWLGGDAVIPVDLIDACVEVDVPMFASAPRAIDDTSAAIGAEVAGRVPDGATLQLGIGAVPDAVLAGLTEKNGLGIWTEMISDGVLALDRSGALDGDRDIVTSFLFGSEELYEWVDGNPKVVMRRSEITNNPGRIAANPNMISVNTALEIDLLAQANASRIKGRIFSGFGGQTDFIVGALHSIGGEAILALKSWHPKADVSTIVPQLSAPVTSFQPSLVVTENGSAEIFGQPQRSQVRHLIERVAHPDARPRLTDAAHELGYL